MKHALTLPPETLDKADKLADRMGWDEAKALGALVRIWVKALEAGSPFAGATQLALRARANVRAEGRELMTALIAVEFVFGVEGDDIFEIWHAQDLIDAAAGRSKKAREAAGARWGPPDDARSNAPSNAPSNAEREKNDAPSNATSIEMAKLCQKREGSSFVSEASPTSENQDNSESSDSIRESGEDFLFDASEVGSRERTHAGARVEKVVYEPDDDGPGLLDDLPEIENLKHARALASACATEVEKKVLAPSVYPDDVRLASETLQLCRAVSGTPDDLRRAYVALARSEGASLAQTRLAYAGRIRAQFKNLLEAKARAQKSRKKQARTSP